MRAAKEINFKHNFKEYLELVKKYKWIAILIILIVTIHEIKQVVDKYLFKIIIDRGSDLSTGIISSQAFIKILIIVAIVFSIGTLSSVILNFLRLHFLNSFETNMMADLKRKYFNHILTLDHGFHVSHKTGSLISRLGRGSSAIERITDVLVFNFVTLLIQIIIVIFSLIYLDWISSVVVFITTIVFIAYSFWIQRLQEKSNLEANRAEDIEKANVADIFTNIDSIKYFGQEKMIKNRFFKITDYTKKTLTENWNYSRWMSAGQSLILGVGTIFLLYFPLMKFMQGELSIGTLAFIYTIFFSLMGYMFGFVSGIRNLYRGMADLQDLFEYGKINKDIIDKPSAKKLQIKDGEIEFNNVSFYHGKRQIFKDFNLVVEKNKKYALVGHSGCGKTTLVKLLYRFYDVDSGKILIDGKDIREFKQESLRNEMSIVPQECILFDDTIYNNVAFSRPSATEKEVMRAIKFAQLDKIIENFPNKEKTIVGERGVKLSGGEKQRVSIARAILANKKILILDEATSSLDSKTEYEIQKDFERLMEGRTSIIIAHRLSTIMKADKIIVIKEGKIVQIGKHSELINQPGEYKSLWNLQKGGYIEG